MAENSDPDATSSLFCNYLKNYMQHHIRRKVYFINLIFFWCFTTLCNKGLACLVCNNQLSKSSIIELRLGLPVTESILYVINALILQEPLQFLEEIYRSLTFRQEQLNLLLKRKIDSYKDIEEGARKREEHYQIEIKELQAICENLKNKNESLLSEINEKEKTLNELKQAYMEKSNQKENIENMYTALRSQISQSSQSSSSSPLLLQHSRDNNNNTFMPCRNGMIPFRERNNNGNSIIMNRSYSKVAPIPSRSFDIDNNSNSSNTTNTTGRKFLRSNFSMVRPSTPSIQKHFGSFGRDANGNMNQHHQQQQFR